MGLDRSARGRALAEDWEACRAAKRNSGPEEVPGGIAFALLVGRKFFIVREPLAPV